MALTAEQQAQLEFEKAQQEIQAPIENARLQREAAQRALDNKMEAVRIAQTILMENDRNKAVGERGIAASDVTVFADALLTYINS